MGFNDEQMAKDWGKITEKYAVEDDERPAEPEPEVPDEPTEPEPAKEPTEARARDESGKFVKGAKDKDDKPAKGERDVPGRRVQPRVPEDRAAVEAEPRPVPRDASRDLARAPSSWRPAAREGFDKLPEGVRAEIHRRETEFAEMRGQLAPDADLGRSMRATIEPYRMLIEAEGGTPQRAVGELLRTAAIFRVGTPEQKWEAYRQVGRQFLGIDIAQVMNAGQPGQPAPGAQPNPNPAAFRDPRVDQLLANQARAETEGQRREQAQLEGVVTKFMSEVDAQGNPKRPYLNDVINKMAAILPEIREQNPGLTYEAALEEGYQQAIWAHPEIRPLLQRQAASDASAKRRTESLERVREAKRAASVNVRARASIPNPGKPGKMEDTLASKARELGLIS